MAFEHIETVATAAGLSKADFDALNALPADTKDFKPEEYTGKITAAQKTVLINDSAFWDGLNDDNINPEYKKKIESGQYARAGKIMEQKLMKVFGFTDADLSDLTPDEQAKFELKAQRMAEKFATSKASDKEIQAELLKERKKVEELSTKSEADKTEVTNTLTKQFEGRTKGLIVLAALSAKQDKLAAPARRLAPTILADLEAEYDVVTEGLDIKIKQKGKPNLDVTEGSKVLTFDDILTRMLKKDNLLVEDKKDIDPKTGKVKIDVDSKDGSLIPSHIEKEAERVKNMK